MKRKLNTTPTGAPTGKRRRGASPFGDGQAERTNIPSAAEIVMIHAVKQAYGRARSRLESLKAGEPVTYVFPRAYDGLEAVRVTDGPTLQNEVPSEWLLLVRWCKLHEINPETYVRDVFATLTHVDRMPEPANLRSDRYLDIWQQQQARVAQMLVQALAVQKDTALRLSEYADDGSISAADSVALVLGQENNGLSPLFRYCAAAKFRGDVFRRLMAQYLRAAVVQFYAYRTEYLIYWRAFLPRGFAAKAERLYPDILAGRDGD